jgi:molybdopterin converting factor small subunit
LVTVNIPAPLRSLSSGAAQAQVEGSNLREVLAAVESLYPGVAERLVDGDRVRAGMAVFVDGSQVAPQLSTRVGPDSEVYFAPAVAGGGCRNSMESKAERSDRDILPCFGV